ncbi:cytochrome c maturation protein CcmE [Aquincola sp. S2]|uniref:Cytochrome c-type biogenesis protein CcmE n=1 Tax=Pseudaquabacterium terrae TaxID=2732868 RepID=A0ABX2ER28_9BURK|nr:cytochrome c maturation protein CcmE [Aquabacterium terrae]NRF71063.1 cytochrome c maturation protein CcmE [Aquabacterium terrae]
MKPRHLRLALIAGGLAGVSAASALVLNALNSNVAFFYTPTQISAGEAPKDRAFRVGGLVKPGSVRREQMTVHFVVTDTAQEIPVHYTGILPDLFREGKGTVVQGRLAGDRFAASEVLAKHDENYMPPEAQHAVDQAHKKGARP